MFICNYYKPHIPYRTLCYIYKACIINIVPQLKFSSHICHIEPYTDHYVIFTSYMDYILSYLTFKSHMRSIYDHI